MKIFLSSNNLQLLNYMFMKSYFHLIKNLFDIHIEMHFTLLSDMTRTKYKIVFIFYNLKDFKTFIIY